MRIHILRAAAVILVLLALPLVSSAATFSSTKAELLYGSDYERNDEEQFILTLANATGFKYGDSFFFIDAVNVDNKDATDGTHLEWGPRLSLLRTFGNGQLKGFVKDVYLIAQADITSNRFTNKTVLMGGVSVDLNIPGFKFFKVHVQYRDDPTLRDSSYQLNLVWNLPFKIGSQNFAFEGFLDYTGEEGDADDDNGLSEANILAQPQLLWLATPNLGIGIEYQYWGDRFGNPNIGTESLPQFMVRWTF